MGGEIMLDYTVINDDVIVQKRADGDQYDVLVFSVASHNWVIYNSFISKEAAIEWAKIEENVK